MIYETKGLSLEQVDELYGKVSNAWQSKGFVPTLSFADVIEAGVDTRHMSLIEAEHAVERRKSSVAYVDNVRNEKSGV
jgi:SP family sugar:H+ symporter-like MFS transporter